MIGTTSSFHNDIIKHARTFVGEQYGLDEMTGRQEIVDRVRFLKAEGHFHYGGMDLRVCSFWLLFTIG